MSSLPNTSPAPSTAEDAPIASLYRQLLERWNTREAAAFAALFDQDGYVVGFDGSSMHGCAEIEAVLRQIFADHVTAAYVGKIRGVRFLNADVAVLRAVVGMLPPGASDINPAVNALQTLVAARRDGDWSIALFQSTPAQFHGRPDLSASLTEELRQLLSTK